MNGNASVVADVEVESLAGSPEFEQWWRVQGEWVEPPNVRRGGESGVQRLRLSDGRLLYAKRQTGHLYRSVRHPFGRPTILRERDALQAMEAIGIKAPHLVYCDAQYNAEGQWRALLVSEDLRGFQELDAWYASGGREQFGEEVHDRILQHIAAMLGRFHRARWRHGCLYQKHLFVRVEQVAGEVEVEVAMLDLEKSRRVCSARRAARHDMQQLRRHSSWSAGDWSRLVYCYEQVFGRAIKGLQ